MFVVMAFAAKVELPLDSTYTFQPGGKITRFVNASPESLTVIKSDNQTLLIRARRAGPAQVYYWTDKQNVLQVQVINKPLVSQKTTNSGKNTGVWETYFKLDPANATPVNQKMLLTSLDYAVETEYGLGVNFFTRYRYNAVESGELGQVENLSLRLGQNGNYIALGDSTMRYTELTVPYLEMQGIQGHARLSSLLLDVFTGKRPGNYWGREVGENYITAKDQDVSVAGGRAVFLVNNNLNVGYSAASRKAADADNILGVSTEVHSGDVQFRKNNYTAVLESADSERDGAKGSAQKGSLSYNNKNYGWQIEYRDVAPQFSSVSDYFNYGGMQGWSLYGSARPVNNVSFSGSYENYLQRFDHDYLELRNEDYNVERLRLRLGLDRIVFFRPAVSYYQNFRADFRSTGWTGQLYDIEIIKRRLWFYYNASLWQYNFPAAEYSTDSSQIGFQYRQGWVSYRAEHVNDRLRYIAGGDSYGSAGWNLIATLGEFRLNDGLKLALSYWHQNRKNTLDTLDKNRNSLRAALGKSVGDIYWYLNGVYTRENSLFYEYEGDDYDRNGYFYHDKVTQTEISGGMVYKF
ncbi:hypothetical protein HP1_087 [Candidatus Termititenax spirochaetophilus]|uniref:Uncharacterized protein n=1 Tax=Candidatus Termititenax spirochaetophilus TaxID=2218522 RepID=A0A388T897_9BACT|nr:hypothetical protein HP1_087 [Candidatus Termititenax spirochaetophilus]